MLAGHDGLPGNINNTTHTLSPSSSVNNTLPTIDPVHGLLLGNTTAFDAVATQPQDHRIHLSPSQQQAPVISTTSPSTRLTDLYPGKGPNENESSSLLLNGELTRPRNSSEIATVGSWSLTLRSGSGRGNLIDVCRTHWWKSADEKRLDKHTQSILEPTLDRASIDRETTNR